MSFVLAWSLSFLVVALVIRRIYRRGLQVRALSERGIAARAQVASKWRVRISADRRAWALRYRFEAGGTEFSARTLDVRDSFTQPEPGDAFDVYYLPENPGLSAPAWLIEEARQVKPT